MKFFKKLQYFNFLKANILQISFYLIPFFLWIFDANSKTSGGGGMSEFEDITTWIKSNLQGPLGKAIAFTALAIAVITGITNFRWIIIGPCAGVMALILIAPRIIETAFALTIENLSLISCFLH